VSHETSLRSRPTSWELFLGSLEIASRSFGGAAAWTRYVLVLRRGWVTDAELTELWSVAQLVPGPNVVNLVVHLGDRARGLWGALSAFLGIIVVPTVFVILLDAFVMRWVHIAVVHSALVGLGAAAAGLVWAMGIKMGERFKKEAWPVAMTFVTFVLAGPLRVPLPLVVLSMGPMGVVWARRRKS
jgi:chromate transporter